MAKKSTVSRSTATRAPAKERANNGSTSAAMTKRASKPSTRGQAKWSKASVQQYAINPRGLPQPVDYQELLNYFSSWCYVYGSWDARMLASVPLRMYRVGKGEDYESPTGVVRSSAIRTRPLSRLQKMRFSGRFSDPRTMPCDYVMKAVNVSASDLVEVTDHPLIRLLRKPNPWFCGRWMMETKWLYKLLIGNAYWQKEYDPQSGNLVSLRPLPGQWVRANVTTDGFMDGYWYGYNNFSSPVFYDMDEVIHFKLPNPGCRYDGFLGAGMGGVGAPNTALWSNGNWGIGPSMDGGLIYGRGIVETVWQALVQNAEAHTYSIAQFANNARPDLLILFGGMMDDAVLNRYRAQWDDQLRGTRNAGRPYVMDNVDVTNVQVHEISKTINDLSNNLQGVKSEIGAAFGFPESMVSGRATLGLAGGQSAQDSLQWVTSFIAPMLQLDEQEMNNAFSEWLGDEYVLAYDDPVAENREQAHKELNENFKNGLITRNEGRLEMGMDEVPDGDRFWDEIEADSKVKVEESKPKPEPGAGPSDAPKPQSGGDK